MRLQVGKKGKDAQAHIHDQHVTDWQDHQEKTTPVELEPFLTDEEENEFNVTRSSSIKQDSSEEDLLFDLISTLEDEESESSIPSDKQADKLEGDDNKETPISSEPNETENIVAQTTAAQPVLRKQKLNFFTKVLVAYSVGVSSFCGYEVLFGKDARLEERLVEVKGMFDELNKDYSSVTSKVLEQAQIGDILSTRIDEVATTSLSDFESLSDDLNNAQGSVKNALSMAESSKTKVEGQDGKIDEIKAVAAAASLTSTNSMEIAKSNKGKLEEFSTDMYELKSHADEIINKRSEASESYKEYTSHINGVVADLSRNIKGISPNSIERIVETILNRKLENTAFSAKYQVNREELNAKQESSSSELVGIRSKLEKHQDDLELKLSKHGSSLHKEVKAEVEEILNQMRSEISKESELTALTRQEQGDAIKKLFKQIDLHSEENKALTNDLTELSGIAKSMDEKNRNLLKSQDELHKLVIKTSKDNVTLEKRHKSLAAETKDSIKKLQEREQAIISTLKRVINMMNTK